MSAPTPLQSVQAILRGYAPRVLQARGFVLAALPVLPVALGYLAATIFTAKAGRVPQGLYLVLLHTGLFRYMVPIMALVAAPAGIREDLEQRTLPLMLTRPTQIWALPFAKGLLWWGWGSLWLLLSGLALVGMGAPINDLPYAIAALLGIFWAELAFLALFGLVFKRGNLWGALWLFLVDPLVRIFPSNLQRFTFVHYAESITGSRATDISVNQLLAQTQISTHWALALLILAAFGLGCWALSGMRLQTRAIGLGGVDAEG
jgi:hypothetical protein